MANTLFAYESLDDKRIKTVDVQLEYFDPEMSFDKSTILNRLKTKTGERFSQTTFDSDLKMLYDEYDRVEPSVNLQGNEVVVNLKVWPKPLIHAINWEGNKRYSKKKLQKELGIKPNRVFNRQEFNKSFNKVKEYYVKRGYFESQLSYSIVPVEGKNMVDINVQVDEGPSGHIKKIVLKGFNKQEQNELLGMIHTKQYNFLISWLTGQGIFHEDMIEQDRMSILNYLHNKGYADARADIVIEDDPASDKIIVRINAVKGQLYHVGVITYDGNTLIADADIKKKFLIQSEDIYSPEKIRDTAQAIKDLYGQKGYIEADVQYEARLNESEPVFNIDFTIEEGQQFRIGLIRVFGNSQTQNKVILRESLLVPGELFDSRKLKATQTRLEGIGYFKNVNVYAVKSNDDLGLGPNYRDVYIEVEETTTGSISLFLGFSSTDDIFGGLDLTERNFNISGVPCMFSNFSKLRGGGEYLHARASLGKKQTNYLISWMDPYFRDSLWRFGFEVSATTSNKLQASDYDIDTYGFSIFASYPLTTYWTYGTKYRFRYTDADVSKKAGFTARELDNSGILSAVSTSLSYDSTDSAYKPHRGIRTGLEAEVAGLGGKFQFLKLSYVNTLYQQLWSRGVMKYRGEIRTIQPFGNQFHRVPLSERYFLGGDSTVRGYKPFILGKKSNGDPLGGLTSLLLSIEYDQEIFKMLDAFIFADAGSISQHAYQIAKIQASVGGGVRLELINRTPIVIGWGYPINPNPGESQKFFFSMGGQF